jgi:hypothetical protein
MSFSIIVSDALGKRRVNAEKSASKIYGSHVDAVPTSDNRLECFWYVSW